MDLSVSRRAFIKLSGLALGSLVLPPFFPRFWDELPQNTIVRVAYPTVSVYREPKMNAPIVGQRFRDEIVNVYYELTPPEGPAYNPLWYRVWGGYMHSAYLQPVQMHFNRSLDIVPERGQLAEVTVPYTQSYRFSKTYGWQRINRLYYQSTHWLTGLAEGPDRKPWYRITDELQPVDYYAPALHFRPIPDDEFQPLSPEIPFAEKFIEISLQDQSLTAFERDQVVLQTTVSTGLPNRQPGPNGIPTITPIGQYNIFSKMPSKHMGNARLTDDLADYILLGVPWTSFFVETGVAFHGTFWHNNFGWPMSRGCVNMRTAEAKWLYRWISPEHEASDWEKRGFGTRVIVY